jgi:pimeloyl-ACP methyl ester carboxylesterase
MTLMKRLLLVFGVVLALAGLWGAWIWSSIAQEEVEFNSGQLVLRGVLLSPRSHEPTPAVVLVHGSGEVTRKSMMAYAWLFALKGFAALAYDKRGLGESEGEKYAWREFNFEDLASDAAAAYTLLRSRNGIDASRVGFFGASQGAWVVSLAATQVEAPAFMIMASASVSTVAEDRIFGREAQVRHAGFDEASVVEASRLIRADHEVTRYGSGFERLNQLWSSYRDRPWFHEVYGDHSLEPERSKHRAWEKTVLDFDPMPLLQRIDAPVLWIFGDPELDRFSPVALSVRRVTEAKARGSCYQILQLDGVGHTLEPPGGATLISLLSVRVPLVLNIYEWLDDLETDGICSR